VYGFIGLIFANKPSACLSFKVLVWDLNSYHQQEPNNTASVFKKDLKFVLVMDSSFSDVLLQ
jgi:lipopolysaccharide biosynthesis glycosyltransferase